MPFPSSCRCGQQQDINVAFEAVYVFLQWEATRLRPDSDTGIGVSVCLTIHLSP